jgi:hypothetical protein
MKNFLLFSLAALCTGTAAAQASSQSVYSDQTFDPAANEVWYQSPILLTVFVLLIGTGGYLWYKRKN